MFFFIHIRFRVEQIRLTMIFFFFNLWTIFQLEDLFQPSTSGVIFSSKFCLVGAFKRSFF